MKNLTRITIIGGLIIIGLLIFLCVKSVSQPVNLGGVPVGSECKYSQKTGAIATTSLIQTGGTTLCGVCITEDQAGAVVFLDATSTTAYSVANGIRIADFQSAFTEGCYELNAYAKNGLVMVSDDGFSFAGDWSIFFR